VSGAKSFRFWLKDDRGVSAIEFAMIAPVLAVLLLGIIDLSSALSQRFTLQQAVDRSLEIIQANRVAVGAQGGSPDYSFLKAEVATAAKVPEANVTLTQWLECKGVKQGSYTGACADYVDTARYLELQVTKPYKGKMYLRSTNLIATQSVRVQ
jgi:Flp pilus assembly protein TadG